VQEGYAMSSKAVRKLSRKQWASRINSDYKKTVDAFWKLGQRLLAAKEALRHGEFLKMIENELLFSARTAQRFMKIASDPKLANATHASYLPDAWPVQYELTKLPAETFAAAVKSGAIHSDMTCKEAKALTIRVETRDATRTIVAPYYPVQEAEEAAPLSLLDKLARLENAVVGLSNEVRQHGDITKDTEKRIRAAANTLLSLTDGGSLH
jgi:hypothetical protein